MEINTPYRGEKGFFIVYIGMHDVFAFEAGLAEYDIDYRVEKGINDGEWGRKYLFSDDDRLRVYKIMDDNYIEKNQRVPNPNEESIGTEGTTLSLIVAAIVAGIMLLILLVDKIIAFFNGAS